MAPLSGEKKGHEEEKLSRLHPRLPGVTMEAPAYQSPDQSRHEKELVLPETQDHPVSLSLILHPGLGPLLLERFWKVPLLLNHSSHWLLPSRGLLQDTGLCLS